MTEPLLIFFAVLVALVTLLAYIAVWGQKRLWLKWGAVVAMAMFMPAAYASLSDLLSRPKPIWLEWSERDPAEAEVLGSDIREGEAIYVWLLVPGRGSPRAYALPWSREMAQQLQDAGEKVEETGTGLMMRKPFERNRDDQERVFYVAPQEQLPVKKVAGDGPVRYRRPDF